MNLAEYLEAEKDDSNAFWRLSSGDHLNLLEEAVDEIERLKLEIEWLRWHIEYISEGPKNHVTPGGGLEPWTAWREMLKNLLKNQGAESLEKFIARHGGE